MYARLILFTMGPGTRMTMEALMKQLERLLRVRPGLMDLYFIADDEIGQYGVIVFWETNAAAEIAQETLLPRLKETLTGLVEELIMYPLFEVIEMT